MLPMLFFLLFTFFTFLSQLGGTFHFYPDSVITVTVILLYFTSVPNCLPFPGGIKTDVITRAEFHHFLMRMHRIQELEPFDNLMIQFNKLIIPHGINIDFNNLHLTRNKHDTAAASY